MHIKFIRIENRNSLEFWLLGWSPSFKIAFFNLIQILPKIAARRGLSSKVVKETSFRGNVSEAIERNWGKPKLRLFSSFILRFWRNWLRVGSSNVPKCKKYVKISHLVEKIIFQNFKNNFSKFLPKILKKFKKFKIFFSKKKKIARLFYIFSLSSTRDEHANGHIFFIFWAHLNCEASTRRLGPISKMVKICQS